jgi:exodeoxyribonuclease VII small subunit
MSKASELPEHTFESAIARLEGLVEEMESDRMPLEQLLVAYEEGTKLVKVCQLKLTEAEKKIEIIQRKAAGEVALKDFDPAGKADPSSAPDTPPAAAARRPSARDASLF